MKPQVTFKADDSDAPDDFGAIDATYYQRRAPPGDPFAFAKARAKDKARVKLIRAIIEQEAQKRVNGLIPQEVVDVATGRDASLGEVAHFALQVFLDEVVFL
jgi:hypothetical protein